MSDFVTTVLSPISQAYVKARKTGLMRPMGAIGA
nr:MAG TPA: AGA PTS system mannose/fructose/sorbose family IID component [Microviridae sp.]